MKDGERGQPIENYGKKEQKEWLDNTLPDPHPCTAGNKEEDNKEKKKIINICAPVSLFYSSKAFIYIAFM